MENNNEVNFENDLEFMIEHADTRFNLKPTDIQLVTDDGRFLSNEEIDLYIQNQKEINTTVSEELSIGDVVKISQIDVPLTIVETKNSEGNHLFGSDYGGKTDIDSNQIIIFEQDEIEEVISKSSNKSL